MYILQGEKITGSVGAGQQALLSLDIFTPFIIGKVVNLLWKIPFKTKIGTRFNN